jgi:hypothetical protein
MLLEPIYEKEFHDFSFGFRPRKSPHQALEYIYSQCYEQQEQINQKLTGHYAYYGITGNSSSLREVHYQVKRLRRKWLGRRNRDGPMKWKAFGQLLVNYPLTPPRIVHPYRKYVPSETMI